MASSTVQMGDMALHSLSEQQFHVSAGISADSAAVTRTPAVTVAT
jgi:hypothetical protein